MCGKSLCYKIHKIETGKCAIAILIRLTDIKI